MKQSSRKKIYTVIRQSPYDTEWVKRSVPVTYLQAVRLISEMNWHDQVHKGKVKIVTDDEFNTLTQGA